MEATKAKAWGRCHCGTRIEVDPNYYGEGYVGEFRDACQPCWEAAEDEAERLQGYSEAFGPEPLHWNSSWDY
jgi:hypothetical protein